LSAVVANLVDVTKTFGPTIALDRVSLQAFEGEVHAIIGGNGSGKSTLAKVVSGVLLPESGQISIFGKSATTPAESKALGISNVYQEVLVADECSVLDNLFLGADGLFETAEPREDRYRRAQKMLTDLLGFDLDPDTIVGELPLSLKQWITIARGMLTNPRLLILDESSAALDYEATERLFAKMREMKAGGCAIFIVTHRIAELVRIADRATVLRDGRSVGTLEKSQITEDNIMNLIAGADRKKADANASFAKKSSEQPLLRAHNLQVWPNTSPFDFNLHPGEIIGVTGLDGQGQADFVKVLAGVSVPEHGWLSVVQDGKAMAVGDMYTARKAGISYVSGDRKKDGILPNLSIFENMVMSIYPTNAIGSFLRFVDRQKLDPIFEHETGQLATKMGDPGNLIGSLSGGNQQKVLIARAFAENPKVLVLNDPARGIDVGAKLDLYRNLRSFAARGNGVVFLSSEIEEFADLCTRVLVFRGGVVSSQFEPPFDTHVILNATFGRRASEMDQTPDNQTPDMRTPDLPNSNITQLANWRPARNGEKPAAKPVRTRVNLPRRLQMNQSGFMLLSPDIAQGAIIPARFAEANKVSPALEWEGVPEGTRSLALAMTDPDLPEELNFPRSFAHWLVYNIPADATGLREGASMSAAMPSGSQELNSDFVTFNIPGFGRGYGGPWPPNGPHRYVFTLFALKTQTIELPQDSDFVAFSQAILPVTIEQASFTAIYGPANAALPAA
jgi:ribose transport system ATP-binding protein